MSQQGPRVNESPVIFNGLDQQRTRMNAAANYSGSNFSRSDISGSINSQYGGKRDLFEVLGYAPTSELSFANYWARYQRFGPATALVDRFVDSTWQSMPDVEDDGRRDTETDFEEAVGHLFSSEALRADTTTDLRMGVPEAIILADKYATLGEYSLLFLGFADGPDTPLSESVEQDQFDPTDDISEGLSYVSPISQKQVSSIETVGNPRDPRYGLPEYYEIDFDEDREATEVHHTRVIHIVEGTRTDSLHGEPALLRGWNRFDDLQKLLGGSAEMAWRGAYPGITVTPLLDEDGVPYQFSETEDEIEEEVDEWRHKLNRILMTAGDVEVHSPNIADVSNHVEMQYRALSAAYDIPQSIYMGNETGERATKEDRRQWSETNAGRRNSYGAQSILRPFINRLRYTGILPDPEGDDYEFEWESLTEMSEQEWAELLKTKAETLKAATGGQPTQHVSSEEVRTEYLDLPQERGGAVDDTTNQDPADAVDPILDQGWDALSDTLPAATDGGESPNHQSGSE